LRSNLSWIVVSFVPHTRGVKRLTKKNWIILLASMVAVAIGMSAAEPLINSLNATPNPVILGSSSNLAWQTIDAETVYIDQGIGVVPPNGSLNITPASTTKYTMVAINGNNSTSSSVDVEVAYIKPTINYFRGEPDEIGMDGKANLSWNVTGATLVSINQGVGSVPVKGNRSVSPIGVTKYTLNASNESGSIYKYVTIGCIDPTVNLTGEPKRILYGDQATLSWEVTEANSISIDQGIGNVPANGKKIVSPTEKTTYTLIASNPCGEEEVNSTTIDVTHVIYNFVYSGKDASWRSGKGNLHYSGSRDDSIGSALLIYGKLVKSNAGDFLLWTHPNWQSNGYIEGAYDLSNLMLSGKEYVPDVRDHISGKFGLLDDSDIWPYCGEVTFKVVLKSEGVPDFVLIGPTTLNCENTPSSFDAFIPTQFIGKPITVVLRAEAGEDSDLDHAAWNNVILMRG